MVGNLTGAAQFVFPNVIFRPVVSRRSFFSSPGGGFERYLSLSVNCQPMRREMSVIREASKLILYSPPSLRFGKKYNCSFNDTRGEKRCESVWPNCASGELRSLKRVSIRRVFGFGSDCLDVRAIE